jgi:mannose-6-phosphate isomerase-like protein (cupin superfamily)
MSSRKWVCNSSKDEVVIAGNQFSVDAALNAIVESTDDDYGVLLKRGTLEIGFYKPRVRDPQEPHEQDEVYVVQSGTGYFVLGEQRQPFSTGDALFVPARKSHRFEDFSEDFSAWVVFYGPEGGEAE